MKRGLAALALLLAPAMAGAQMPDYRMDAIPVPTQPDAIPLYPAGSLPQGAVPESWTKVSATALDGTRIDGGRAARNVAIPTMTPVLPDPGKATGAAVLVAPGGAFTTLAMDTEGFAVARWLADHGIAAFVLKYRLNPSPADQNLFQAQMAQRIGDEIKRGTAGMGIYEPRAPIDALRALKLIRTGAAKWHVDPSRVGMIGFSAGAITTLQSVLTGDAETQPSFIGYIYGRMTPVTVPTAAPPMFAALALDDPLFGRQGFGVVEAWQKAGRPVELHAYEHGDHGFGLGRPGTTTTLVMDEFRLWLDTNGFLRSGGAR